MKVNFRLKTDIFDDDAKIVGIVGILIKGTYSFLARVMTAELS